MEQQIYGNVWKTLSKNMVQVIIVQRQRREGQRRRSDLLSCCAHPLIYHYAVSPLEKYLE